MRKKTEIYYNIGIYERLFHTRIEPLKERINYVGTKRRKQKYYKSREKKNSFKIIDGIKSRISLHSLNTVPSTFIFLYCAGFQLQYMDSKFKKEKVDK